MARCTHVYGVTLDEGTHRVCCSLKCARLKELRVGQERSTDPSLWAETVCPFGADSVLADARECGSFELWGGRYDTQAVYALCIELAEAVPSQQRAYFLAHHWLARAVGAH